MEPDGGGVRRDSAGVQSEAGSQLPRLPRADQLLNGGRVGRHPLWDLPTCLITPHTADTEEMTQPLLASRIAENVRRLAAGQDLVGLLNADLGY